MVGATQLDLNRLASRFLEHRLRHSKALGDFSICDENIPNCLYLSRWGRGLLSIFYENKVCFNLLLSEIYGNN